MTAFACIAGYQVCVCVCVSAVMQAIFSPPSVTLGPDSSMTIVLTLPEVAEEEEEFGGGQLALVVQHGGSLGGGGVKNREMKSNSVDGGRNSERNAGL